MTDIDGSTDEVAKLVHDEYGRLVRAVAMACGSMPTAEDAVQEALARAWVRAQKGQEFDHLAGWVVTVALNLSRSGARRRARHRRAVAQLAEGLQHTGPPDVSSDLVDLRQAVDRLPRRQREVVVLHYYLGYDVASVAARLGVSSGTVKTALFRARAALAAALDPSEVTHHD